MRAYNRSVPRLFQYHGARALLLAKRAPIRFKGGVASTALGFGLVHRQQQQTQVSTLKFGSLTELYDRCSRSTVHLRLEIKTADELPGQQLLISNGSGFILDTKDYTHPTETCLILTSAHVVTDMSLKSRLWVKFFDGQTILAQVVCIDAPSDLAIVQPIFKDHQQQHEFSEKYPPLPIEDSPIQVGQLIVAIGSPFGMLNSLSAGVVSRTRIPSTELKLQSEARLQYVQTDLSLFPGNSGGPIINAQSGKVIGIASVRAEQGGTTQPMGTNSLSFAIDINSIKGILKGMINEGHVRRAWLGFRGTSLTREVVDQIDSLSQQAGLESIKSGVVVLKTYPNSPASKAKLKPGDVIVAVNNRPVQDIGHLLAVMDEFALGQPSTVEVRRVIVDGKSGAFKGIESLVCSLLPDEYDLFLEHKDKPHH